MKPVQITYRRAEERDLPAILALLTEIMEEHGVTPPDSSLLEWLVRKVIDSEDHLFLVAAEHETVVGLCVVVFSMSTWSGGETAELQDLIVTAGRRKRGIGRGLVAAALDQARARGCRRAYLLAETWNLDAHGFYRHLGFKEKTCFYFEKSTEDVTGE